MHDGASPEEAVAPVSPPSARDIAGALVLFSCTVFATAGVLSKWHPLTTTAAVLLGAFIAWELIRVPGHQLLTSAILLGIGLAAAVHADAVVPVLIRSFEGTLVFAALFVAMGFLQYPAIHSPSMQAAKEVILRQPPGRRYATLSVAAHLFGALTNFAAMTLLSTFLRGDLTTEARERMACAMIRGFALAASWSPFFVSIAVILYIMPSVKWAQIAVPGLPLAALMLFYGWAYDRIRNRPAGVRSDGPAKPAPRLPRRIIVNIGVLAVVLVGLILTTAETLHIPTPIAIFAVVPGMSIAWQWLLTRKGASGSLDDMLREVTLSISKLRAEIVIFLSANFLGYGAARAADPAAIGDFLSHAGIVGSVGIYLLLAFMLTSTMLMIHPLVLIVLLGQIFPGEMLGIHDVSLALCMALVWGVGTTSSPASGLTLFMTRNLDGGPWHLAWGLNGLYSIFAIFVGGTYISVINALLR